MVIHGDVDDVCLPGAEDAEGSHVGGGLGEDDVARVDEELGDEVEGLLAAGRDHHVVGVRADDSVVAHDLGDALAQDLPALAATVLHGLGAVVADQSLRRCRQAVEGKVLQVGHASGEGDDLRSGDDGKEGSNLGGAQVVGAVCVDVEPGVEPVTLRGGSPGPGRGPSVR